MGRLSPLGHLTYTLLCCVNGLCRELASIYLSIYLLIYLCVWELKFNVVITAAASHCNRVSSHPFLQTRLCCQPPPEMYYIRYRVKEKATSHFPLNLHGSCTRWLLKKHLNKQPKQKGSGQYSPKWFKNIIFCSLKGSRPKMAVTDYLPSLSEKN